MKAWCKSSRDAVIGFNCIRVFCGTPCRGGSVIGGGNIVITNSAVNALGGTDAAGIGGGEGGDGNTRFHAQQQRHGEICLRIFRLHKRCKVAFRR